MERTCQHCIHFDDDPASIEREFPYLTVFGSAYSAARGEAGICNKLDRFLDPQPARCCPFFEAAVAVVTAAASAGEG
jgi:hypothetical protein